MVDAPKPSTICCKCGGRMELGLLTDSYGINAEKVALWVRGFPRWSIWDKRFAAKKRDRLQIATLRCTQCGYLELYAPDADASLCRHCNYNRTGLPMDAVCPECGGKP